MVFPVDIPDFPPFGKDTVFLGTKKNGESKNLPWNFIGFGWSFTMKCGETFRFSPERFRFQKIEETQIVIFIGT